MIKVLLMIFFCVGTYIGVMLAVYALYNKFAPYDESADWSGAGDPNKIAAMMWPVTVPFFFITGLAVGLSKVMDLIRKHQKDGDSNA